MGLARVHMPTWETPLCCADVDPGQWALVFDPMVMTTLHASPKGNNSGDRYTELCVGGSLSVPTLFLPAYLSNS